MGGRRAAVEQWMYGAPAPLRSLAVNLVGLAQRRSRFGGEFARLHEWLLESERWPAERLRRHQAQRLREVLRAAEGTPYWAGVLERHGVRSGEVDGPEGLAPLPVLTKGDIRANFAAMVNPRLEAGSYVRHSSSGTTGQKLEFLLPKKLLFQLNHANLWRFYAWGGIRLFDRRVTLGGRYFTHRPPYWVHNRAENQLLLSIHHLNEATVDAYIARVEAFRPRLVQGHPSGLHLVAARMLALGRRLRAQAVFTTGETLSEEQRADLQAAFGARVYQTYGLGEGVFAASECERQQGYHESSEVGIIDFEPHAESGLHYVVGTSLWNTAMPFLRYRVEDLVERVADERCSCGRTLPLRIRRVVGRTDDVLRAADGRVVLPVTVRMVVKPHLRPFENYQVQQVGPGTFRFCAVGDLEPPRRARIEADLRGVLGAGARIEFTGAEGVVTAAGKVRNVVNVSRGA